MDFSQMSIDERLAHYKLMLDVAMTDEKVKPLYADYGYDETRIQEGKALFDTAFDLNQKQKKEYGEKYGASDDLTLARQKAAEVYGKFVELGRIVFKHDRDLLTQLDLGGKRKDKYSEAYVQMLQFYDTALASTEIQNKLARFGRTVEHLQAGKALVDAMQEKYQARRKESSEAERATADRDDAMDEIDDWMSDFRGVSRLCLKSEPQYLERLGLVDPSE